MKSKNFGMNRIRELLEGGIAFILGMFVIIWIGLRNIEFEPFGYCNMIQTIVRRGLLCGRSREQIWRGGGRL